MGEYQKNIIKYILILTKYLPITLVEHIFENLGPGTFFNSHFINDIDIGLMADFKEEPLNLEGIFIEGYFVCCSFRWMSLRGVTFRNASLYSFNLFSRNMRGVRFIDCVVENSEFSKGDMSHSSLKNVKMHRNNFRGTVAAHSRWENIFMDDCFMCQISFLESTLEKVVMPSCHLISANCRGANFKNVIFPKAIMMGCDMSLALIEPSCQLPLLIKDCDFSGANINLSQSNVLNCKT